MVLKNIREAQKKGERLLAILMDPEKVALQQLDAIIKEIHKTIITHILIGGSTDKDAQIDPLIKAVKDRTHLPIIIFPGDANQVSSKADAILFLSLISGRNPEYLIEQQIRSIPKLEKSNLEVIPTGYLLIDGGKETAVQKVSGTKPIPQEDIKLIQHTALAGYYGGKKLIYLEAGSGALVPVNPKVIAAVRLKLKIPLIVGGGIRNKTQLNQAYAAGADMIVIGTVFEDNNRFFDEIKKLHKP